MLASMSLVAIDKTCAMIPSAGITRMGEQSRSSFPRDGDHTGKGTAAGSAQPPLAGLQRRPCGADRLLGLNTALRRVHEVDYVLRRRHWARPSWAAPPALSHNERIG